MRPSRHRDSACLAAIANRGESRLPSAWDRRISRVATPSKRTPCRRRRDSNHCETQTPSPPARHLYFLLAIRLVREPVSTKSIPPTSPATNDLAQRQLLPARPWRCRYPKPGKHTAASESSLRLQFRNSKIL